LHENLDSNNAKLDSKETGNSTRKDSSGVPQRVQRFTVRARLHDAIAAAAKMSIATRPLAGSGQLAFPHEARYFHTNKP
jgi:hypothetical protein